ncbi:transglutaminase domain-containing protein [Ruminococcus sp. AF45-4BH]|nr:transglutaminase domain-containing protein [Ruminococcus sp. AF45-4BH]
MESGAGGTSYCSGRICSVMVYFHAIGRSGDPGNSKRHDKNTESAPAVSVEFSTEDFRGKSAALSGRNRRRGGQRRTRNDRRCVFYRGGCPESDQCAETSETVYLRGYIGETYTGNSFEPGAEENFQNAAAVWKTDGDSSIYIQNLPFLRTMYYEKQSSGKNAGESESAVNQITVENLNANPEYTYVPYDAFLNDVYQISNGDGAVCGQSRQDDIFSCYWRSNAKEILESYRDGKDTSGVLNDTEKSYRNFCSTYDLQIPEKGLERLKKECAEAKEENHWGESETGAEMPDWAVADEYEEIRKYVVKRLLRDCSYETDTDKLKDGQDFVETFLYDTKEGYSMHFAAAATMMFRMFGVPARYVVGYVAPQELFSENADQTYTAVLEDDNAHTWVEIYQPFLGWTPVEVTPGMEQSLLIRQKRKSRVIVFRRKRRRRRKRKKSVYPVLQFVLLGGSQDTLQIF